MGEHLAQLKKRQDILSEEMQHLLSDRDTHNAYIIELQNALRVAKTRQAAPVFRYRATWDKFAVVSDAIAYYEPDVADLMSKSELC